MIKYHMIKTIEALAEETADGSLANAVVKGLNLSDVHIDWPAVDVKNAFFVGCTLPLETEFEMRQRGAMFFPPIDGLPYDPYRSTLYTPAELMEGWHPDEEQNQSLDRRIERHFYDHGGHDPDIMEALAQTIHDFSIDNAIKDLLGVDAETGLPLRKAVGIMGGHLARRDDPYYVKTAELALQLTKAGYFVVCGGGPGIMEAANLGAYMGCYGEEALDDSMKILQRSPEYALPDGTLDPAYINAAQQVLDKYPNGCESLAIPTWFYGHEPVNMFAPHIGKYFSNSLREDGLLAISVFGIAYAPGSAATTQEVFADAAQNHYGSFDYLSPMVFLGSSHYLQSQVYTCLTQQAAGHEYASLITISDEPKKLVDFISKHPPLRMVPA